MGTWYLEISSATWIDWIVKKKPENSHVEFDHDLIEKENHLNKPSVFEFRVLIFEGVLFSFLIGEWLLEGSIEESTNW